MFFYCSKLFWAFLDPVNLLTLLFGFGLAAMALRWKKTSTALLTCSFTILFLCGVLPLGQTALHALESRYPTRQTLPEHIDGILVLGGAIETQKSELSGRTELNEGAERITSAIALAQRYPQAKIVFSGGNSALINNKRSEGADIAIFLEEMGVHLPHVIYEEKSRNTYENIINSYSLVHPQPGDNWILLTSAFHLPRSLAIARKQGWGLIPYPVDYRSQGRYLFIPRKFDVLDNLYASKLFLREMTGFIAYKITGKL